MPKNRGEFANDALLKIFRRGMPKNRGEFAKKVLLSMFTKKPKNKIQPTNDLPTLRTPQSQQYTNIISQKKRSSSSSQRSSKGSQKSLTGVEIFLDSSPSSATRAKRLRESKKTQDVVRMSLPGRTSRSASSVSPKVEAKTKSSVSPKVETKTKSSVSPKVEAKTKLSASPSAAAKTKSAMSAPAALSRQTKRSSSTAKIGLENMNADTFDIILKEMFKNEKSFVLDFHYLKKIKEGSMVLALSLNPLLIKLKIPQIETYLLPNIITINLAHNVIDEYTLNILNLTVKYSKVSTIILRNINFENDDIADKFLEYLKKNTQIKRLILRGINIGNYLDKLVDIIGKLTNITLLEFSNFSVNTTFHRFFLRTLIKLKNLKHLIFNNNKISSHSYALIFSGEYQRHLPDSSDPFKKGGVYFIDNYVIKTNFYDNNSMTIYLNKLNNLDELKYLDELDDNTNFKQMNSLNFHAYGNYYPITEREQFISNSNVSESKLYNYTNASIQNIMNNLESELDVPNLSLQMK
jgi:hypothetical protein